MENQFSESSSLFGLAINENNRGELADTARWARFLAIVGFVMCGLIVLVGFFAGSIFSMFANSEELEELGGGMSAAMGAGMAFFYVIIAVIYFIPCLFLFRFANKMKLALSSNDQAALNTSFQNLKSMFRFFGIVTIIMISIYAIILLIALVGAAAMG